MGKLTTDVQRAVVRVNDTAQEIQIVGGCVIEIARDKDVPDL